MKLSITAAAALLLAGSLGLSGNAALAQRTGSEAGNGPHSLGAPNAASSKRVNPTENRTQGAGSDSSAGTTGSTAGSAGATGGAGAGAAAGGAAGGGAAGGAGGGASGR